MMTMAAETRRFSRTAVGVAAHRAVHQLMDGDPKVLDDPISGRLLGAGARAADALTMRVQVVLRSRYAEDRLAEAVRRGVRQCVILGAGLDTFAYRQPAWADGLRIFEVDHPASQAEKRRRLASAGVPIPENLVFASIDFETTSLAEGLPRSGVDFSQRTFFSCLGVLVYLTARAARAVFELVARFPAGSEIAFSYATPRATPSPAAQRAGEVGEPWLTAFDQPTLARELLSLGFSPISFLDPLDSKRAYFSGARADGLAPPRTGNIGAAIVGGGEGV
jgi:methyltransferase (TIGR00027 family)